MLFPRKTKEVGIGVSAALAAVDDEEFMKRELEAGGESVDLGLELALGERGELVEEGQDEGWVGGGHEDLQAGDEKPQPEKELVTSLLNNLEEAGEDGRGDSGGDEVGLDQVAEEQSGRLLVKAVLLLQDEGVVKLRREIEDLLEGKESKDEENRVADLARESSGGVSQEPVTRKRPNLGKDIKVQDSDILDLIPETVEDGEEGFCTAVFLRFGECFRRYFLGEDGGGRRAAEDTVLAETEEGLEEVVAKGEAHKELLPRKERAVQEPRQALLES